MRDLRTWMVALALAAAVVLLAPAIAMAEEAVAAEPSPSATPVLTVSATPTAVTAGDRVRLVVGSSVPGATVQLSRMRAGESGFTPLRVLQTGAGGAVVARVTPPATTVYRVEYAGDAQWLPATAEVAVSVRPRVSFAVAERVYRGRTTPLTISVRPLHPAASVTVQRWSDGAWADWKSLRLDSDSRVRSPWRGDAEGVVRLRVVMAADAGHLVGASVGRRIRVVKPNPYNVPLDAKGIVVVDISQYTLRFYSYGRLLRAFPCVTGRPSLPTPIGHFSIYARGMWPGGPYGSRIMSYHPPCAIHGTNEPWLLSRFPRNFSHGCTRLSNAHAIWLYDHAPLGTPVWNVP